jgi:hypothetical protein
MTNPNPWLSIPLDDYERHMSHHGEIFSIVIPEILLSNAAETGYKLIGKGENVLPNGKSIITFHFVI